MSNEAIRIRPFHRAPIRRAAVTGLFALWLAPLPADAQASATETCTTEPAGRVMPGEGAALPDTPPAKGQGPL